MILVNPSHEVLTEIDGAEILRRIEGAGRTCYKSENFIDTDSAKAFVQKILKRGHESVIEHESITVKIICDRGVTHEIVRHRLCAYSQESTRYCNYKGGVTFIIPPWIRLEPGEYYGDTDVWFTDPSCELSWLRHMLDSERVYIELLDNNWSPGQARSVLPNSLKAEIVMTANIREWRHILRLRTSKAAHVQMHEVMVPILEDFKHMIPILFDDIEV